MLYACRSCRSVLLSEQDLMEHVDLARADFKKEKKDGKGGKKGSGVGLCALHFLRAPLPWMALAQQQVGAVWVQCGCGGCGGSRVFGGGGRDLLMGFVPGSGMSTGRWRITIHSAQRGGCWSSGSPGCPPPLPPTHMHSVLDTLPEPHTHTHPACGARRTPPAAAGLRRASCRARRAAPSWAAGRAPAARTAECSARAASWCLYPRTAFSAAAWTLWTLT